MTNKKLYATPSSREFAITFVRPIATSGTLVDGLGSVIDELEVDDWGTLE